ncbi:MAG TPA: hypothetical protein VFJ09_11935 [Nocardioidaceae bacterium]|nr:hypothetical protein [Nocardioidaceae bacterium]
MEGDAETGHQPSEMKDPAVADGGYNNDRALNNVGVLGDLIQPGVLNMAYITGKKPIVV